MEAAHPVTHLIGVINLEEEPTVGLDMTGGGDFENIAVLNIDFGEVF
jgi:hypothetical protein